VLEIHVKTGADLSANLPFGILQLAFRNTVKAYGNVQDQEILPNKVGGPAG